MRPRQETKGYEMKKLTVICLASLSLFACTKGVDPEPTPSPLTSGVQRQADIYAAVIGGGEKYGDLWIVDQICPDAGQPSDHKGCTPMSADLKAALLERFPAARFTSDPQPMQDRLMEKGGVTINWVGPMVGSGDTVQVPSGYWCGGLCGSGGIKVVEFKNGEWKVTGSVGGTWVS